MHWHQDLQIILVLEGEIHLKIGYESIDLKKNDLMLINSNEIHSMKSLKSPNNILFLLINDAFIKQADPDFYDSIATCPFMQAFEQINQNRNKIYGSIESILSFLQGLDGPGQKSSKKLSDMVKNLLSIMASCHKPLFVGKARGTADLAEEKTEMINRLLKYLRENFDHKISLQEIAEKEFISIHHLSHSIKDITGYSFREWINYYRLERAEKLLLTTELKLSDVSNKCGFSDPRYFYKQFKKWHNMGPSDYRKQYKLSKGKFYDVGDHDKAHSLSIIKDLPDNIPLENGYNKLNNAHTLTFIEIDLKNFSCTKFIQPWKNILLDHHNNHPDQLCPEVLEDLKESLGATLRKDLTGLSANSEDCDLADTLPSIETLIKTKLCITDLLHEGGKKTNRFFLYKLLGMLGNQIITINNEFLITTEKNEFQVFLINTTGRASFDGNKDFIIQLSNKNLDYIITSYTWYAQKYKYKNIIKNKTVLKHLTDEEKKYIDLMAYPEIFYDYLDSSDNNQISFTLEPLSAKLIILRPLAC